MSGPDSSARRIRLSPEGSRTLFAALLIAAAAGLRFFHLTDQSLWNDEMFSLEVARSAFADIQPALIAHYHHPPVFFYLLHFLLAFTGAAGGDSVFILRLISAAAGSLTVGLVFYYATRMFDLQSGVVAASICLVAPFHVAYSQEGRPYALAALFALVSCCSLSELLKERLLKEGRQAPIIVYAASSLAVLYTHHWGLFVIAAQVGYALLSGDYPPVVKKSLFGVWVLIGVLYLAEVPGLVRQSTGGSSSGWFWVQGPGWSEGYWLAGAFSGTYFKMASAVFDTEAGIRILGAAAVIALAGGAIACAVLGEGGSALRLAFACCAGALLIPFAISFAKPEVFLWYRYPVIVFPFLCILIGAVSTRRRWIRWGMPAAGILLTIGSVGTVRYFSWSKSNARDIGACVDSLARPGVNIVIRPRSFAPLLEYYYKGGAHQLDETYLDKPRGEPLGAIVDTASAFIYVSLDVPSSIREYMDRHFQKISERRFPGEAHMGMVVGLYRQPPEE